MRTKAEIRQEVLSRRNNMHMQEVQEKSNAIYHRLKSLLLGERKNVLCYISFSNEVSTRAIIDDSCHRGLYAAVPGYDNKMDSYIPCHFQGWGNITYTNYHAPQPKTIFPANPRDVQIVIVPGVAFDRNGNRIGFGTGHFDRLLATLSLGCSKIGLAFSEQIVEKIPIEQHDIPMDYIITEREVILASKNAQNNGSLLSSK